MSDTKQYTDVMVDLETTGTLPDRNAIIQISAVKFNLKTMEVSPDFFDQCLTVPKHRSWDEGTRKWWSKQMVTLDAIQDRARPWQDVFIEFVEWAYPMGSLRFWSKPTHFDYNFISSYCHDLDLYQPFSYREATDMNSFLRGLYFPDPVKKLELEFQGVAHNAIDDTLHQIKEVMTHYLEKKNALISPTADQS